MKEYLDNLFLRKIRFTPRWVIFFLDIICVILAIGTSYLLRFNFDFNAIQNFNFSNIFLTVIVLNIALLYAFKSYKGIVRYTTLEDAGRIFIINFVISSLIFIFELIYHKSGENKALIMPYSIILIYFFTVSLFQISYRIGVKKIFSLLFVNKRKKDKAVIFNARNEGRLVRNMISENQASSIKIVGFVDTNSKFTGKKIENTPVLKLDFHQLQKLKKEGVNQLIIADPYIRKDLLNEIVDMCLELDIRVQQVPSYDKWINNKLDERQLKDINIEQLLDREVIKLNQDQLSLNLKNKKVLVTGAAGSIGSEIVRQVLSMNPTIVIAIDNAETPLHDLKLSLPDYKNIVYFIGDIGDRVRMEQAFEIYQPDVVYHAAAYKHVPLMEDNPSIAIKNNVVGSKNLAELSVEYGVDKFVMVSTDKAVNPTNVMGASKRIAEIFTQAFYNFTKSQYEKKNRKHYTKFITTRFGNVLGSNGSVIPRFTEQLREGGPLTVTHPEITRYFMTIPEACRLVLEAGAMGEGGEIFVFDMGKPVKIVDLARKMIKLAGFIPDKDIMIEFTGLRPGEKLYEELLNNSENTLPTYHHKIMIAQVREYDFSVIHNQIDELISKANHHINMSTVAKMKEIVPEFISQNSIYQQLDKK